MNEIQFMTKKAAEAHSNLNTYAAVVALMEGGLIYGIRHAAATKIIRICKQEQQHFLRVYDGLLAQIRDQTK